MSDITLDEIRSGYNLSRINDNFEKIEDSINEDTLHVRGGNNTMSQQLDMNSKRITNLPVPVADTDPLRKGDVSQDNTGASLQYVDDAVDSVVGKFTFDNVGSLTGANYLADYEGTKVYWLGYYETSDGGNNWGVVKKGAHTADGGSIFTIDANTYIEANLKGSRVSAKKFGVKTHYEYDESVIPTLESSTQFINAQTWCSENRQDLYLPAGRYYYEGMLNLGSYKLVGDGIGQTYLYCHPDGSRGYFIGNENTILSSGTCALEGIEIVCFDWNNPCFGAWLSRPIQIKEVMIRNFAYSGCFMSHDTTQNGPYYSRISTLFCERNGEHGFVLGAGANAIDITNLVCRWNGTETIGQANPPAGNYDGFYSTGSGDDRIMVGIPYYSPESLSMSGGDCSYNSRYGWNIDDLQTSSDVNLGYTELNKGPKQIRIGGSTRACNINARHGSTFDLSTSETNANLYPNRITTSSGYSGTGYTPTGSVRPIDNQTTHDVRWSAGSEAIINITKDSAGRVTYKGSGANPRITYDSTIQTVFNGKVDTTAFKIDGKGMNFIGGSNLSLSATIAETGSITISRIGSNGGFYFEDGVGIYLKSPNGTFFKLTVDDSGNLGTV